MPISVQLHLTVQSQIIFLTDCLDWVKSNIVYAKLQHIYKISESLSLMLKLVAYAGRLCLSDGSEISKILIFREI